MKPKTTVPKPGFISVAGRFAAAAALCLTLQAQAQTPVFTNLWKLAAGTYSDLPQGANNNRGVAINPINTNILYASTTGGTNGAPTHVSVLDQTTNFLGQLNSDSSVVSGGTLGMAPVKVADDGAVYACNVSGAPASTFKLYRWASDDDFTTPPTVVFSTPGGSSFQYRVGDWMDVRGSGTNTEIIVSGSTASGANVATNYLILKPADETLTAFTNVSITFPGGALAMASHGLAWEGTNNAFYAKRSGAQTVYRIQYNPETWSNWVTASFNLDQSSTDGIDYAEVNGVKLLSAICYATTAITNNIQHKAKVFQITGASNYVIVLDDNLAQPFYANPNGIGMTDIKNGRILFGESGNGISLYSMGFVTNTPPSIAGGAQPGGGTVVEGFNFTFTVNPSGSAPLSYQWYLNETNSVPGGSNTLTLNNLQLSQAGGYTVVVTNAYGSVTSLVANLNVLPARFTTVATQLWTLAPGSRDYLTTTDTQRSMDYDPVSGSLVLVSRAPTNGIHVLNATTGADAGELDYSVVAGLGAGFFPVNAVAVADDGAVFVCNLILNAPDTFAIYRWDSTAPSAMSGAVFYQALDVGRIGDTLVARGAGTGTELLASFRTGTNVALFDTIDGFNLNAHVIAITNLPPDAQSTGFAGLGLAWGAGNTFWAKSSGYRLRLVEYDLPSLTGRVIASYDTSVATMYPIGVDVANGLLGGIGAGEVPQNLQIYDLEAATGPELIDRELFATSNANGNGTGSVSFDVANGRIFALNSNNGILALSYIPLLRYDMINTQLVLSWAGPASLQRATSVTGPFSPVTGATSPYTNTLSGQVFYRLAR